MLVALLSTLAVVSGLFTAVTYLLWLYEQRRGGDTKKVADTRARYVAGITEWFALLATMLAWPFGVVGKPRVAAGDGSRPVVLVHGWSLNRASLWLIAARLRRDGRTAYAINYPSMIEDTDAKAAHVAASIESICTESGSDRVDVVAHSLGGVLVRAAIRWHGADRTVANVVSLGSPHRGTALALLLRRTGVLQTRPGSRFLERLHEEEKLPLPINFTAIASSFDAICHPLDLCYYAPALNVTLDLTGHHVLLYSERAYAIVRENLELAPRTETAAEQAAVDA